MLSSLLKEHQQRQHLRREEQERKKKEATAAASALTAAMVDHLNVGVAQAYLNQRKLDAEAKQLHTNATNFSKQAANWLHLVDNFNHALKELGDIENWAKSIEADMVISAWLIGLQNICLRLCSPSRGLGYLSFKTIWHLGW
uniref:Biogenesis of lysosome-related organelles complex 1 subunit 1 n=1 Tax=Rhipicephalus microplus TaxID=6941 RepID=A0A6M2CVK3_RHIMP